MKLKHLTTIPRFAVVALLTALAVWPVRADYQSTMLSLGPIGYWRFQETNPSPALNIITNASGLGSIANGICQDNPGKGQPGIIGTSIRFTNTGTTAGFAGTKIDVPWNAAINPNPPFSIEFWAMPNSLPAFTDDSSPPTGFCPLSNFDPNWASGGSRAGWLFYINNSGTWAFRLGNRSGYAGILTGTSGNASPGAWQHMVATWDGTNALLYANGAVIASAPISVANWADNPQEYLRFGATPLTGAGEAGNYISALNSEGNRGYDGWLEEVAIYSNVLSPATISAHYAARTGSVATYQAQILSANPAGFWPMQDATYLQPTNGFPVATNIGSLGTAADGTNYFGALANQPGPGYAGFGANSKSVFFDGDNGYCQITDCSGLHWATNDAYSEDGGFDFPTFDTNYITMAAWIKPTEENFFRDIIAHGWEASEGDFAETFLRISPGIGNAFTGDGNYYEVGASDGAVFYDSVLVPIPPGDIGNWVFLVGTFDGANWNLYRDGVLAGTVPAGSGSPLDLGSSYGSELDGELFAGAFDVTNWWTIGSRGVDSEWIGYGLNFGGNITEAAVFSNALAPSDVLNLYNAANVPPVITQAPVNPGTVFTGSTVAFSVWADGNATLVYLWKTNGVSTGVTTTNYSISNITPGTYTVAVVVSNPYGTNTPSVIFPVVNAPPAITSQPLPQERFVGFPFSFSVGAGGSAPLAYYWKLGSTVVQTGSSATYSNIASLGNAGSYTVIVSNITGITVTSSPVSLVVHAVPGGYPGQIITNGPIAYYRLDETNGTEAFDAIGGNNGTYFGIPNQTTLGVPGYSVADPDDYAVSFDGTNSYVGNINGTNINFTGHTNFSLEAWVNAPSGLADQSTIIAKGIGNNGTTETEQFSLDVSGGVYRFFTAARGGAAPIAVAATDGPNGTWQHVVGVYDDLNILGGGSNMYIYVNGVLEGQGSTYVSGLNDTESPVSIGSKRTGNNPNYDGTFNGSIDQVAIYNYALSATQVFNDYGSAYPGTPPTISIQPTSITNYAGLPITFSVTAFGAVPLSYQWNKNNVPIGGANSPTLTIAPVSYGNAGNYSVTVSNSVSHSNSVTVALVVLAPPTNTPSIPGLVMHLTFNGNLNDATGRGNNGTGMYVYNPAALDTNSSQTTLEATAITNLVSPDTNGGANNPSFYYDINGTPPPVGGVGLHYSTMGLGLAGAAAIGTNDYYVSLGVRPDLQFGDGSFTVSYWIQLQQNYQAGDLPFFTDAVGSTFGTGFVFAPAYGYGTASPNGTPLNYGGWAASIEGATGGVGYYGDLASINDGFWHNLVHVADRSLGPDGTFITYLDGKVAHATREGGTTLDASGTINTANAAVIGQDPSGQYGETGAADIADLGVWKRALSPLEAAAIYISAVSNQLSFTAPVTLTVTHNGGSVTITWPSGVLQSSTNLTGTFTNVPGAVSPLTVTAAGNPLYYRVNQFPVYIVP